VRVGILEGKNVLVAGVTLDTSIAFHVARIAQAEGATVLVSNFGRAMSLTNRVIKKLDPVPALLEVDVTNSEQLAGLAVAAGEHVDRLDGLVHSLAFANPETALGGKFLSTPWSDVGTALHVSAYSLASLTMACRPLFARSASVVGMTFDATVSWPVYDWMGVAKSALESTSRYLARYLGPEGVRVNLVAAGPLETLAKKAIGGAKEFNEVWAQRAPLGWEPTDMEPTARAVVALLSDWFPRTTGEMVHVDGGVHAMGA
jgi:enoyl-[acyl-carrier protein] reductase I